MNLITAAAKLCIKAIHDKELKNELHIINMHLLCLELVSKQHSVNSIKETKYYIDCRKDFKLLDDYLYKMLLHKNELMGTLVY